MGLEPDSAKPSQLEIFQRKIAKMGDPILESVIEAVGADLIDIGITELATGRGNSRSFGRTGPFSHTRVTFGGWSASQDRLELKLIHGVTKREIKGGFLVYRQEGRPSTVELGRIDLLYEADSISVAQTLEQAIATWIEPLKAGTSDITTDE